MILSICIPSYNHLEHLQEVVNSVIKAKSDEFELVIVDNGSSKDIFQEIKTVDTRVKLYKRDRVVSGPESIGTCIDYANAKYRLVVIDKDCIDGDFIDKFIEVLKTHSDIKGGRCFLNASDEKGYKIISDINDSDALKLYYTDDHPTGYFYCQECIEVENRIVESMEERWNPFNEDMLLARCASMGKMLLYESPLVYSSLTKKVDTKEKSSTYLKGKAKLFFEPEERIHQMLLNITHLNTLMIDDFEYRLILDSIYQKTLNHVTLGYKKTLAMSHICEHYGIISRRVGLIEMLGYVRLLNKEFINSATSRLMKQDKKNIIIKYYFRKIPLKLIRKIKNAI